MYLVIVVTNLFLLNGILTENSGANYCGDQKRQEGIDIRQLTGMWFSVETITHLQPPTASTGEYYQQTEIDTDTCAVVTISDKPNLPLSPMYKNFRKYNQSYGPEYKVYQTHETETEHPNDQYYQINQNKHRHQLIHNKKYLERKYLSIKWDEGRITYVYAAYYTFPVGLWQIYEPTEDELSPPSVSSYPIGNIQVLKAVGNHLVLSFCFRWPEEKFYTVVLSRSPKLNKQDLSGVHNLLRRLQLDFVTRRRMCLLNSAAELSLHYIFTILSLVYTFLVIS